MNKKTEALKNLGETIKKLSAVAHSFDTIGQAIDHQEYVRVDVFVFLCEAQFELVNDLKEHFHYLCAELEKEEGTKNG